MSHGLMPTSKSPLLPAPTESAPAQFSVPTTERRGYALATISAVFFSSSIVLNRFTQTSLSLPLPAAVLLRSFVQLIITTTSLLFVAIKAGGKFRTTWKVSLLLATRGLLGSLVIFFMFLGLKLLYAGDVSALLATMPLFALLFGYFVIHEPISLTDISAGLLSVFGSVLVASPWSASFTIPTNDASIAFVDGMISNRTIGVIVTLIASLLVTCGLGIVRILRQQVHCLVPTLATAFFGTLLGACLGGVSAIMQADKHAVIVMIASAALGCIGQVSMSRSLQLCRVGAGIAIATLEVPFTYMIAVVLFHETPGIWQVCGAMVVVASSILLNVGRAQDITE